MRFPGRPGQRLAWNRRLSPHREVPDFPELIIPPRHIVRLPAMTNGPISEVKPLKFAQDLDLADRAIAGDAVAVREFQDTYRPMLERVLMSRGVDRV